MSVRRKYEVSSSNIRPGWSDPTCMFYKNHALDYARATIDLPVAPMLSGFVHRLKRGDNLVDLGCGAGRDLKEFRESCLEPVGIDYSYPLCVLAHRYSRVPVVNGDMQQLPFANGSFAGASAVASLLHLYRTEIPNALGEISRVLNPGGLLFTSMKCGSGEQRDDHGRWFSYFAPDEWINYLQGAGFIMVEVKQDYERRGSSGLFEDIEWINCICTKK